MMQVETRNAYTFEVANAADKIMAVRELEELFGIKVEGVTVSNRVGKMKRVSRNSRTMVRRPSKKVMTFTLKKGDKIDLFHV